MSQAQRGEARLRAPFQAQALLTLEEARSCPSLYRTVVPSQQGQFQVYPQTRSTDSHHSEYRQAGFARTICLDNAVLQTGISERSRSERLV